MSARLNLPLKEEENAEEVAAPTTEEQVSEPVTAIAEPIYPIVIEEEEEEEEPYFLINFH